MAQSRADAGEVDVGQGSAGRLRRRSPWLTAAVVAFSFLALVVGLLALPGGKVVGDTTTNIRITTPLPALAPGDSVVQPMRASASRLAAVYVTFGTYFDSARCDLRITLRERPAGDAPGAGPEIASQDWSCSQLPDTGRFQVLEFPPVADSEGKLFDVVIERIDHGTGQGVAVWAGEPKGDALRVLVDGQEQALSAEIRGEYDPQPHQWDHIGLTLRRLAEYGPAWGATGVFVALLALLGVLLALGPVARRSTVTVVVVVALLAIVRGLVWSAAVPALEGMDEPAHFGYVQFLAEEHEFPGNINNHEIYSPRLEQTIAALNVEATTPGDRPDYGPGGEARVASELENASPKGGGAGPGTMYAPFYYLPGALLYEAGGNDILAQITFARLWSVLLGALAAVLLVVIGRQLFPRSTIAQLSFVIAGVFQPMIAHQFAIVNNDAWVIAAGFGALAVGLELARRGRAPGLVFLAGAVIGAGLLGKPFAIACAVPPAVGWVVGKVRARQRSLRVLLSEAGLALLGVAVTFGAWTLAAARLGLRTSEVPSSDGMAHGVRKFLEAQFGSGLQSVRTTWADQLWGDFGWVRIPLPPPVPLCIFVIEIALLLGLGVWIATVVLGFMRRRWARSATDGGTAVIAPVLSESELRAAPLPLDVRILILAATIVGIIGTIYAAGWVYYESTGANNLIQGRYALLAIPAFIAAPALLLERFTGGRVKPAVVNTVAALGMVTANLLGLLVVFEAFYG